MADKPGRAPNIADTFIAVHSLLLSTKTIETFLEEVARLAATAIDPPASVGVTMGHDHAPFTVAATDAVANRVDETQYAVGEGPCIETMRTGLLTEVEDQRSDERWGGYAKRAVEHGVRSSLSLPLLVHGEPVGAVNIYSLSRARAFDGPQREHAETFGVHASTALTLMIRHLAREESFQQLEQALTSRTVIDHAIGVLMGQQRCNADEAFALLRRHSQNTNRKLRDVASELVIRVTGQPPAEPRSFQRLTDESSG